MFITNILEVFAINSQRNVERITFSLLAINCTFYESGLVKLHFSHLQKWSYLIDTIQIKQYGSK